MAIPGVDVDGDPRSTDVGVVEIRPVDVDVVVAPETVEVGPAVADDPDRHSIVEVHNVYIPGIIVEGCSSSGGCAAVGAKVRLGVQEVVDACADCGSKVA